MMPNKSSNNEIFCKMLIIYSNMEQLMYYVFLFDTNQKSIYNNCDYILKISMTCSYVDKYIYIHKVFLKFKGGYRNGYLL